MVFSFILVILFFRSYKRFLNYYQQIKIHLYINNIKERGMYNQATNPSHHNIKSKKYQSKYNMDQPTQTRHSKRQDKQKKFKKKYVQKTTEQECQSVKIEHNNSQNQRKKRFIAKNVDQNKRQQQRNHEQDYNKKYGHHKRKDHQQKHYHRNYQKHRVEYNPLLDKYPKNTFQKLDNIIPPGDLRRFKQLCANVIKSPIQIQIIYFKNRPLIHCFYTNSFQQKKQIYLSDVVHQNRIKKITVDIELLWRSFDLLYRQVPQDFWPIAQFGMLRAEERKKSWAQTMNIYKHKQFLKLYYVKQNRQIHFLLLHKQFRRSQYSSSYIQDKKHQLPYQYRSFEKFNKFLNNQKYNEQIQGLQQLDSEQEEGTVKVEYDSHQIIKRMNQIMNKDLRWIYNQLKNKKDQLDQMKYDSSRLDILQQAKQLQKMIQQFQQKVQKVKLLKNKSNLKPQQLKMYLKILIMAERQLQSKLPICLKKTQIFNLLNTKSIIILEGETGSGKSTQLPQFLCEFYKVFQNQQNMPILITQPRKLAARSLAQRVAKQLQQKNRGIIDYQTSINKNISPNARIVFKLDRLVLDELVQDPLLSKYSCMVIDEAHERTISIDVILGRVKQIVQKRKDFKVIITSASMDSQKFREYYHTNSIKISGRLYLVEQIYEPLANIKDIKDKITRFLKDFIFEKDMSKLKDQYYGHILVFCTGIEEVQMLVSKFKSILNQKSFKVLPLHGKLTSQQQKMIFQNHGKVKLIFSTKIAQTSITIDGIKVVVNPGIDRQLIYDPKTKVSTLQLQMISQSQSIQRAGRAGRTGPGYCFHLYSKEIKQKMQLNKPPQMQILPLQTVILRLKALKIQDIHKFPFISRPKQQSINISIKTLISLGCLTSDQNITEIGKFILMIPIQPFLARSIVQSLLYAQAVQQSSKDNLQIAKQGENNDQKMLIVSEVIKILCMVISSQEIYQKVIQNEKQNQLSQFNIKQYNGEFELYRSIFNKYIQVANNKESVKKWSQNNKISLKTMNLVKQNYQQITEIVKRFSSRIKSMSSFKQQVAKRLQRMKKIKNQKDILKACLLSSFINNLCLYSDVPQLGYTIISYNSPILLNPMTVLSRNDYNSKWIVCYNIAVDQYSRLNMKVAQPIQLDFLKNVVDKRILQFFNVEEAQKQNPFYHKFNYQLPSLIFYKVLSDYRNRNFDKELQFLCRYTFVINQRMNSFVAYHLSSSERTKLTQQLEQYIDNLKRPLQKYLQFKYHEKIAIRFNEEFQVIQFTNKTKQFELSLFLNNPKSVQFLERLSQEQNIKFYQIQQQKNVQQTIAKVYKRLLQKQDIRLQLTQQKKNEDRLEYTCLTDGVQKNKRIKQAIINQNKLQKKNVRDTYQQQINKQIQEKVEEFKKYYMKYALMNDYYRAYMPNKIAEIKQKVQRQYQRKYIKDCPEITMIQSQIKLASSIAEYSEWQLHIDVNFLQSNPKIIKLQYKSIYGMRLQEKIKMIKKMLQSKRQLKVKHIHLKTQNLRHALICYFDQNKQPSKDQIAEILKQCPADSLPSQIKEEINPVWQYLNKSSKFWMDQIDFKQAKQKPYIHYNVKLQRKHIVKNKAQKQFQNKKLNIQFRIISNYSMLMDEFECPHPNGVRIQYNIKRFKNQLALQVPTTIFEALQYYFYTMLGQQISNQLSVSHRKCINYQGVQTTYIILRSSQNVASYLVRDENSYQIKQLKKLIKQIFTPVKLPNMQKYELLFKNVLNKSNITRSQFVEKFQSEQSYQVRLFYEQSTGILNLYCPKQQKQKIQEKLMKKIQAVASQQKRISYIEKGLNRIQGVLVNLGCSSYKIDYKSKQIIVNAMLQIHEKIIFQIKRLENTILKQCQICCQQYKQPYRLFNCAHAFCFSCLRNWINSKTRQLYCPKNCGAFISIYDAKRLTNIEQFNKICQRQVHQYVESSNKYLFCFTPDCYNIIDKQLELNKFRNTFSCKQCKKQYCLECKEISHGNWRCSKYLEEDQKWQSIGIKKCPKCGQGVEKSKGCNHMQCRCGAHFCWKCKQAFETSSQCYAHLQAKHGGIYDDQTLNTQIQMLQANQNLRVYGNMYNVYRFF